MLRFVKIQRKAFMALAVPFEIAIDGEIVDSISYKRTSIFPIAEGLHQLNFVFKGTKQPVTEIPDGTDNLVFEDKLKMGLLVNHAVLKYVGTFDASSINVDDDCAFDAVKKCYNTYKAQKRREILAYLNEFRANTAAFQNATNGAAEWLLENELVKFRGRGEKIINSTYSMFLTLRVDQRNGDINWYNYNTDSTTRCLTISNITGWSKERKYAFESALAESVACYWQQYGNNKRLEERTSSYDKPRVKFSTFEEEGVVWSDHLDSIKGYCYSIEGLGRIFFTIKS